MKAEEFKRKITPKKQTPKKLVVTKAPKKLGIKVQKAVNKESNNQVKENKKAANTQKSMAKLAEQER